MVNVLTDDEGDACRLAEEFLKLPNQQQVLFFGALSELPTSKERERGFRKALKDKTVKVDYLYTDKFHKNNAANTFAQWLSEKGNLPTTIFTTSFTLLEGVMLVLLQRFGHVPHHLTIATFGHFEMLELLENPVICSVQDYEKVSQSLLNLAFDAISKKHKTTVNSTPLSRKVIKYHC